MALCSGNSIEGYLRARVSYGRWYGARAEAVRGDGAARELRVHFMGRNRKWDEWVRMGEGRLKSWLKSVA